MKLPFGGPGEIPPVAGRTSGEAFENQIRLTGVQSACEWFGHAYDSEFTAEAIETLRERSVANPVKENEPPQ